MIMSGVAYARVIDVKELRPLAMAYVPMRKGGHAWLCVTRITWGPGGVWGVEGTDESDRHLVSAWSDVQTVEVW